MILSKHSLLLLVYLCFGVNKYLIAQTTTKTDLINSSISNQINSSLLNGRWHLVEIVLELDDSDGLGPKAEESYKTSTESQRKVKQQIQNKELAIITQFNYDGTYTHELVYSNPEIRFPSYKELGTWTFDEKTSQLLRKAEDQEITTLGLTVIKRLNQDELVLELKYTDKEYDGIYKGLVQTVFLKRFWETKVNN